MEYTAKSIADRIDFGAIMLSTTDEDIEALKDVINEGGFEIPKVKLSVYKNRRGRYKDILLWCKTDLGTCRTIPMFATTYNYELVKINDLKIDVEERAF